MVEINDSLFDTFETTPELLKLKEQQYNQFSKSLKDNKIKSFDEILFILSVLEQIINTENIKLDLKDTIEFLKDNNNLKIKNKLDQQSKNLINDIIAELEETNKISEVLVESINNLKFEYFQLNKK